MSNCGVKIKEEMDDDKIVGQGQKQEVPRRSSPSKKSDEQSTKISTTPVTREVTEAVAAPSAKSVEEVPRRSSPSKKSDEQSKITTTAMTREETETEETEEIEAVAALYATCQEKVPVFHAKVKWYFHNLEIAEVVQRVQVAMDPSYICREFLRAYPNSEIICAAALRRLEDRLEKVYNKLTQSDVLDKWARLEVLNQEETELVLETMARHMQSRTIQLHACKLLVDYKFCHRATVFSSRGAQVMMEAVSHFREDEQVQETIWSDLIQHAIPPAVSMTSAFDGLLAAHNALPLGYAAMDRFTQNDNICNGVLAVMYFVIKFHNDEQSERLVAAFTREHPNIDALFNRVRETHTFDVDLTRDILFWQRVRRNRNRRI